MISRTLLGQFDAAAGQYLPMRVPPSPGLHLWAARHGWDTADPLGQRLLLRQAMLNAILRQGVPGLVAHAHETPLDELGVVAPTRLVEDLCQVVQSNQARQLNPWGEIYSLLIPQPQRRQIGQFWTDERIAEWMLTWLLESHPQCLADVGCGAGNFLLKAVQLSHRFADVPRLDGCDISPLLLNVTLAAFLTRFGGGYRHLPHLTSQDYIEASLPSEADAVVCNSPYTRHHQIAPALKDTLQAFFKANLRLDVSRQGTLAFFFMLKLIAEMHEGARAAIIVPMEVLDERYGLAAKRVLAQQTTISAIIHFSPEMNAFHRVDVGAVILLFRKGCERGNAVRQLTLNTLPTTVDLMSALGSDRDIQLSFGSLTVRPQEELLDMPIRTAHRASSSARTGTVRGAHVTTQSRGAGYCPRRV